MCRPSTLISHPETGSSFLSWNHASLLWSILGWPHTRTRSLVFPGQSFFTYVFLISSHSTFKTPTLDDTWCEHPRHEPCHSTPTCGLLSYSSAITLLNFRVGKLLWFPGHNLLFHPSFRWLSRFLKVCYFIYSNIHAMWCLSPYLTISSLKMETVLITSFALVSPLYPDILHAKYKFDEGINEACQNYICT